MNLIVRLLKTVLLGLFARRIGLFGQSVITFRVWPNDLDLNWHMNNGRYLTLCDLGRLDLVIRSGIWRPMVKRRWMPVLGSAMIRYRRSLAPGQRFRLRTRLLCWDEKWVFMEQRFEMTDGRLAAVAVVKGLFRGPDGNITPEDILHALGLDAASPPMPDAVKAWVAAEDDLAR